MFNGIRNSSFVVEQCSKKNLKSSRRIRNQLCHHQGTYIMSRACWRKRTNILSIMGRLKICFFILFCPKFCILLRCFKGATIGLLFRSFGLVESFLFCLYYKVLVKVSLPAAILMTLTA